jgi:glycosyltransferase involved in cell wall biosynthesis
MTPPRLLLLSIEGPHLRSAGGIILHRLLAGYPKDRLIVIEREVDPRRGQLDCPYFSLTPPWRRFEHCRFHRWKRSLRGFGLVPQVPVREIDRLLGGFRPEVVLCVMQFGAYYETAWTYARKKGLPLIIIIHDVNDEFEPVLPIARKVVRRRDAAFYRYATRRLCVSPEMEALCADRYGVRGDVMYPNCSEELRPRAFDEARRLRCPGRLTVGFVGNLNYGYGEELVRMLPAFRASASRLVIFSPPPGPLASALLDARDCVDYRGFKPHPRDAWQAVQSDCDAVLLPYPNPAGWRERFYRYHFPSKLPEYLALGMPVIVTGPDYATGVKWGMRYPDAVACYTETDTAGMASLLEGLRASPETRLALARAAMTAGHRDFDPVRIRAQFRDALDEARQALPLGDFRLPSPRKAA